MIDGVLLTPLGIVRGPEGEVLHAIKAVDPGFLGFGEAYCSTIYPGAIKSWRRHNLMTLNLVVVFGEIQFVVHDDRPASSSFGITQAFRLGPEVQHARLTVAAGLWMAFQGMASTKSFLINVANLQHDPLEVDRKELGDFPFAWGRQ